VGGGIVGVGRVYFFHFFSVIDWEEREELVVVIMFFE